MSDDVKADQTTSRGTDASVSGRQIGEQTSAADASSSAGPGRRIDSSHVASPPDDPGQVAEQPSGGSSVPQQPEEVAGVRPEAFSSAHGEQLLLQASQIADHLRTQCGELDRREQALNEQLALLDQERRNVRLWVHQCDEEMQEREARLKSRDVELAEKMTSCEKLISELEEQERAFIAARDELAGQRVTLKEDVGREIEIERLALREAQRVLEAERKQLAEQAEIRETEHAEALEAARTSLEAEQANLRQQFAADLDAERTEFERVREEWTARRESQLAEIKGKRELSELAVARAHEELKSLRSQQLEQLEQEQQQLEQSRQRQQEQIEQELSREKQAWDVARNAQRDELERARQAVKTDRKQLEEDLTARRRQLEKELKKHLQDDERRLHEERQAFELERQTQFAEIKRQRNIFDNRNRFQQEHLQKSRIELENALRESRIDQQQTCQKIEQRAQMLRLRTVQSTHFRALIEEREKSTEREHQLLSDSRRTLEREIEKDRELLRGERAAWDQERRAQRAEIRRQQDMLTLHAENLEGRRMRLDQLRTELEQTHRRTLEMRMSVEEGWAQLAQAAGKEAAQERVDQAREAMSEHYNHLRQTLSQQRQEMTEAQTLFLRQKDEFRDERQTLTEWVADRDEKLRLWEERLGRTAEAIDTREVAWRTVRDRWVQEKIEAEQIIRSLLGQITQLSDPSAGNETMLPPQCVDDNGMVPAEPSEDRITPASTEGTPDQSTGETRE